jgi:ubiquinone/menaquinone biosynthesis C-methylase UbiE
MSPSGSAPRGHNRPIDYDPIAASYDESRALTPEGVTAWRHALDGLRGLSGSAPLLDLGSGTGIWSGLLADWFDSTVLAVEPSAGMRHEAAGRPAHPRVHIIGGEGERIPIRDHSCSNAWLSTVIHHIPDLSGCARELRRVLRPSGRILIRQVFAGRTDRISWTRFFPTAVPILDERWPSLDAVLAAFAVAGFEKESLQGVDEVAAVDLSAYYDKIKTRTDSTLRLIVDADFESGLARLRKAAGEEPRAPVVSRLDLLVLHRSRGSPGR